MIQSNLKVGQIYLIKVIHSSFVTPFLMSLDNCFCLCTGRSFGVVDNSSYYHIFVNGDVHLMTTYFVEFHDLGQ
jgi:hypothetical protein